MNNLMFFCGEKKLLTKKNIIMARKISNTFLKELKEGTLKPILEYVKNDDTLDMELRGDKVIIYYRGGKILEINDETYELGGLDKGYLSDKTKTFDKPSLTTIENYFPKAKHHMDVYGAEKSKWELDIQQRIVQENNYSKNALSTDYFIVDTEYKDNRGRADIVALRWDSTSSSRKKPQTTITIFEVKQGIKSISGDAGIVKHFNDFISFKEKPDEVKNFISEMVIVFQQKRELGLFHKDMEKYKPLTETEIRKDVEFVFLFANYDSASTKLKTELDKIDNCKIIYANSMGYGLYAQNIIEKEEFIQRFL